MKARQLQIAANAPVAQRGFTLMEVLVAAMLLAFAALAQARMSASIIDSNRQARNVHAATNLALAQLEVIQAESYASIASGADAGQLDATGAAGSVYTRSWTVTDNAPATNEKTVAVTVTWQDTDIVRSIVLQTVVAQ